MNNEEYAKLMKIEKISNKVTAEDLINKEDRTLLYGYTCNRETWHVYLKDGEIHTVMYRGWNEMPITELKVKDDFDYVPNKRLYPFCCDFEFCKLLKEREVNLCFTTYEERPISQFYGKLLGDSLETY